MRALRPASSSGGCSICGIVFRFPEIRMTGDVSGLGNTESRAIQRPLRIVNRAAAQFRRYHGQAIVVGLLTCAPWARAWAQNAPAGELGPAPQPSPRDDEVT